MVISSGGRFLFYYFFNEAIVDQCTAVFDQGLGRSTHPIIQSLNRRPGGIFSFMAIAQELEIEHSRTGADDIDPVR